MQRGPLQTDVLIAGGGPAGLAAAIAARQKGLRVTVAEFACPPVDKACGEGLMPEGVRALCALGISISDGFPIRGIRFLADDESVCADFPAGTGLAVRRTTLYNALAERALDSGVSVLWGARVEAHGGETALVNGEPARCSWLVGADGMSSRIRAEAGLDAGKCSRARFGFRRHFKVEPWTDYVEVHWGPTSQLFVTPVGAQEVCIALLARKPRPRLAEEIPSFAEVAWRLKGMMPSSIERGAVTFNRRLRAVTRGRVALVGDASGSVDAITGEGLSVAFQQALALAEAFAKDDLALYQATHSRIMRVPALMAKLLVIMDRHSWLRRQALHRLAAQPGVFSRFLALHTSALPPAAADVIRACMLVRADATHLGVR